MNGNTTMLVWLGKNILGQSDKIDENIKSTHKVELAYKLDE